MPKQKACMNLKEYLCAKYGVEVPSTITQNEARMFGFSYPLTSNWLAEHGSKVITDEIRPRLIASMTAIFLIKKSGTKGVYAGRALEALGVDSAAVAADEAGRIAAANAKTALGKDPEAIKARQEAKAHRRAMQLQDAAARKIKLAARKKRKAAAEAAHAARTVRTNRPDPSVPTKGAMRRAANKVARMERYGSEYCASARPGGVYSGSPESNMRVAERRTQTFVSMSSVEPASPEFLKTSEWAFVRMQALEGFKRTGKFHCHCCMAAPAPGSPLHVDHIKPRKFFPGLALEVENLQLLCPTCNLGKANWSQTDWRDGAHATKSS